MFKLLYADDIKKENMIPGKLYRLKQHVTIFSVSDNRDNSDVFRTITDSYVPFVPASSVEEFNKIRHRYSSLKNFMDADSAVVMFIEQSFSENAHENVYEYFKVLNKGIVGYLVSERIRTLTNIKDYLLEFVECQY
jgi:hypothetical protein